MNTFVAWAIARLSEASTWVGFASLASAAGIHFAIAPSAVSALASVIAGLATAERTVLAFRSRNLTFG